MEDEQYITMDKAVLVEKIMNISHLTWEESAEALELTLERLRKEGKIE